VKIKKQAKRLISLLLIRTAALFSLSYHALSLSLSLFLSHAQKALLLFMQRIKEETKRLYETKSATPIFL
jgi:hypothetical protein